MTRRIRQRVTGYITRGSQVLVFRHTQFPEAGIQAPGGTVEPGESLDAAALREAEEESGLAGLELVACLGMREYDMAPYGKDEIVQNHFYHLRFAGDTPDTWLNYEHTPSDGGPGPIEFEFWWASFAAARVLLNFGDRDMLDELEISTERA